MKFLNLDVFFCSPSGFAKCHLQSAEATETFKTSKNDTFVKMAILKSSKPDDDSEF